ncbi:hypothetical protein BHM03_00058253 [Ensete ventricosum]|nr:hypothetical protein BHM03_00058253 [Ensete ventricosum]
MYDVNAIVDRLLQFLEMEKDYVTAETLAYDSYPYYQIIDQVLVKDLLRKYPQWSHDCIAVVGNISSKNVQEPKAKAALIWMLGEYSQDMPDAPYILESLIENWDEENAAEVLEFYSQVYLWYKFKQAIVIEQSTDRYADRSLPGGTAEIDRRLSISIGISRGREKEVEKKREKPGSPVRCSSPVSFARSVARGEKERGDVALLFF